MFNFVTFTFILISLLSILSGFLFLSMSGSRSQESENGTVESRTSKTKIRETTAKLFDLSGPTLKKYGIALSGFGITSFLIAVILRISSLNMV